MTEYCSLRDVINDADDNNEHVYDDYVAGTT